MEDASARAEIRERAPRRWSAWLPLGIIVAGAAWTLYLCTFVREGVFFSGDGGLKFLLVRQLASGDFHSDLRLRAEPWIEESWAVGTYPFEPPFVYEVEGRRHVTWPIAFTALTAPFYAALGARGLLVVPLVATWWTWLATWWLLRRLGTGTLVTTLALAGFVFASPSTLYAALFWEHSLGIALAWSGACLALAASAGDARTAIVAGLALALAAILRPELALFAAGVVLLGLLRSPDGGRRRWTLVLAASAATGFGLHVLDDWLAFGHPFGLHSVDVLEAPRAALLPRAASTLRDLLAGMLPFAPAVVVAAPACLVAIRRGLVAGDRARIVLWLALGVPLGMLLAVPLIVPHAGGLQWGLRFLLVLDPASWTALALVLQPALALGVRWRRAAVAVVVATIAFGALVHCVGGPRTLDFNFGRRVLPALRWIQADASPFVVVQHHYIAMELASLTPDRSFLLASDRGRFYGIAARAHANGHDRFPYLTPLGKPVDEAALVPSAEGSLQVTVSHVGSRGIFEIHDVQVRPVVDASAGSGP